MFKDVFYYSLCNIALQVCLNSMFPTPETSRAYTEGLEKKCSDINLNAILFTNRAAANFHLENYGSAIKDSIK